MDRKRLREIHTAMFPDSIARPNVIDFAEQIANLARNEALEEAAKVSDSHVGCDAISDKIRALKDKELK
jgi:hypothetical protein